MADKVTAKSSDAKFKPHPEGQFVGQCVDCIDLGEAVVDFTGKPKYLAQKCALVFRTGEKNPDTGDFIDVSSEFTVSMGELANLRKFLQQWRGKPYTEDQIDAGVPLDKLVSNWSLLTVAHKLSKKGRTYAVIVSGVGVPKQMREGLKDYPDYVREDFWAERRDENAKAARLFRQEIGAEENEPTDIGHAQEVEEFTDTNDYESDESLPF